MDSREEKRGGSASECVPLIRRRTARTFGRNFQHVAPSVLAVTSNSSGWRCWSATVSTPSRDSITSIMRGSLPCGRPFVTFRIRKSRREKLHLVSCGWRRAGGRQSIRGPGAALDYLPFGSQTAGMPLPYRPRLPEYLFSRYIMRLMRSGLPPC